MNIGKIFLRQFAAPASIALAAAGCSPSTISRPDYQPKAQMSGSGVVLSGSLPQIFRQLIENQKILFTNCGPKTLFSPSGKNFIYCWKLARDITIIAENNRRITFRTGTEMRFHGPLLPSNNSISHDFDNAELKGELAFDISLPIAGNSLAIKTGEAVYWSAKNGISGIIRLPLEDQTFNINQQKIIFKGYTEFYYTEPLSNLSGTLAQNADILINNQRVPFKGGEFFQVILSGYFGTLAGDTELVINGQRISFKGGKNTFVDSSGCEGTLAKDTELIINNQKVIFKDGTGIEIRKSGVPVKGTLLSDANIDGRWYQGDKEIRLYPSGRVKKGILARPINEAGFAFGAGQTICCAEDGRLEINWQPLFPNSKMLVPMMCAINYYSGTDYSVTESTLVKGLMIPVEEILGDIPDWEKLVPKQQAKVKLALPRNARPIKTEIKLTDLTRTLQRQKELYLPPNTVRISFDRKGNPAHIEVVEDLIIEGQITILKGGLGSALPFEVIPPVFRRILFSKMDEILIQANPSYK
ncbi:MAG: hypothetical protein WC632_04310 [Candidatus Margulisiibacteriota bacterium]